MLLLLLFVDCRNSSLKKLQTLLSDADFLLLLSTMAISSSISGGRSIWVLGLDATGFMMVLGSGVVVRKMVVWWL